MKRSSLVLAALTLVLGAQSVRVFLPALILYIGEGPVHPAVFALFAYAPFGLALAPLLGSPLLVAGLRPRGAGWVAGGGLIVFRVIEQLSRANTLDLAAGIGATTCFLWLLPLLAGQARADGQSGWQALVLGLLLGLSLDTATRGLTGTLDLSWIPGPGAFLAEAALLALFAWALWAAQSGAAPWPGAGFRASLPLLGLGLLLFIEWQILQNQGYVATLTGWPAGLALGWIMLGNLAALLAATYALASRPRASVWSALLPGAALVLALAAVGLAQVPGWIFAAAELVSLVSAGLLLAALAGFAAEAQPAAAPGGQWRSFLPVWLGQVLFMTLLFIYYMSFIVRLPPFPRAGLAPLAGAGLALCALVAARRPSAPQPAAPELIPARLGGLLLLAPLAVMAQAALRPAPPPPANRPARVMTYNIRSGYGEDGRQDLDGLAQAIAGAGTDVVALQELSRGWLVSGATDDLALLGDRLHMPYSVMGASTDPIFGDAILRRYPILDSGADNLPLFDTLIPRGYVWAQLDLGGGQTLLVITTHLEPAGGDNVRIGQAMTLLHVWAARPQTVILGDMNSAAGSPQMQVILQAGFIDTWAEAGHGTRPEVDWIFHTPDLVVSDVAAIDSPASDHFAVVAGLAPAH